MQELYHAAVHPVNIFPTFLLLLVVVYWLMVMVGLIDLKSVDVDLDAHASAEVSGSHLEWLNSSLSFFNLGKVPFMIFLSFLALPLWVITILANHYLQNTSVLVGIGVLVPGLLVSLFVAKILTTPFKRFFAALDKDLSEGEKVIGRVCTVMLPVSAASTGQASLTTSGAPVLLNIRTPDGKQLEKGKTALVLQYLEKEKCYLVEPYDL